MNCCGGRLGCIGEFKLTDTSQYINGNLTGSLVGRLAGWLHDRVDHFNKSEVRVSVNSFLTLYLEHNLFFTITTLVELQHTRGKFNLILARL